MRRKSSRSKVPRRWRRTRAFLFINGLLWVGLGIWFAFQPAERRGEVAFLVRNTLAREKEITAFDLAYDLWQLYARDEFVAGTASRDSPHAYGGPPLVPENVRVRVLQNAGYSLGYSDRLGCAVWAAYRLEDRAPGDAPSRPEAFRPDPRTTARITPALYERSGYDRGHLVPSYAIGWLLGARAQEETFLMSNIVPQKHALNAGPWKRLEQRIARNYPGRFREVWILAGPVWGEKPPRLRRRVAVPSAFYMIIVDENEQAVRATAFLFPQDTPDNARLEDHLVSIDELERRTGLDFLTTLPDETESILEATPADRVW